MNSLSKFQKYIVEMCSDVTRPLSTFLISCTLLLIFNACHLTFVCSVPQPIHRTLPLDTAPALKHWDVTMFINV